MAHDEIYSYIVRADSPEEAAQKALDGEYDPTEDTENLDQGEYHDIKVFAANQATADDTPLYVIPDEADNQLRTVRAALRELLNVAQELPQPATEDGLRLCDALAHARKALRDTGGEKEKEQSEQASEGKD